jgi:hypothetical protein
VTPAHDSDLPDPDETNSSETGQSATLGQAARRRRLAQVFGEVLPDATSDERGDAWGDREPSTDEWLRRQVPPHHG